MTGRQISGRGAAKTWEPILVYTKNASVLSTFDIDITFAKENMPDSYKGFKKDLREDEHGTFAVGDTLYNHNRKFNEETRPNLIFSYSITQKQKKLNLVILGIHILALLKFYHTRMGMGYINIMHGVGQEIK